MVKAARKTDTQQIDLCPSRNSVAVKTRSALENVAPFCSQTLIVCAARYRRMTCTRTCTSISIASIRVTSHLVMINIPTPITGSSGSWRVKLGLWHRRNLLVFVLKYTDWTFRKIGNSRKSGEGRSEIVREKERSSQFLDVRHPTTTSSRFQLFWSTDQVIQTIEIEKQCLNTYIYTYLRWQAICLSDGIHMLACGHRAIHRSIRRELLWTVAKSSDSTFVASYFHVHFKTTCIGTWQNFGISLDLQEQQNQRGMHYLTYHTLAR